MPSNPWDATPVSGDTPIIRHAPDATGYHLPDELVRSRVGNTATVPAARRDGRSMGFDPTVAGPMHVDPYEADGGVVVDLTAVRERDMEQAIALSTDPRDVFRHLAAGRPARQTQETPVDNQNQPVTVAAPVQYTPPPQFTSPQPATGPYVPPQPAAQYATQLPPAPPAPPPPPYQPQYPPPAYYPPQPPAPDPNLQAMIAALAQQVNNLTARMETRPAPAPPPPPAPPRVPSVRTLPAGVNGSGAAATPAYAAEDEADEDEPAARPAPRRDDHARGVSVPRPKIEVFFDFGQAGQQRGFFHVAHDNDGLLALGFDTRYEGSMYTPPKLTSDNVFEVTVHEPGQPPRTHEVWLLGLKHPHEEYLYFILLKPPRQE